MLKFKKEFDMSTILPQYKFEYIEQDEEYKREFKSEGIALIIDINTRNVYFRQLKNNSFPEMKAQEVLYDMTVAGYIENTNSKINIEGKQK